MNGHAAVKVLLGRAHLDRDPETLKHLPNPQAENVQPDDLLLGPGADDLHLRGVELFLLRGKDVVEHGRETRLVHLDLVVAEPLASLGLRQADGADLGMREHHGRDILVGELGCLELRGPEDATAELATGSNGHYDVVSSLVGGEALEVKFTGR